MLDGDWNSETKWRMYMSHLREIETLYRKLPFNEVSEHFRPEVSWLRPTLMRLLRP